MKKVFLTAFIAAVLLASTSCDSDSDNNPNHPDYEHTISSSELPEPVRQFISANFPNAAYKLVKKQNTADKDGSLYDVWLTNNFEIEFDAAGNLVDIDGNRQGVPAVLVPPNVKDYVFVNYHGQLVTKIDYEKTHYEFEISNGYNLIFDLQGNFVKIEFD